LAGETAARAALIDSLDEPAWLIDGATLTLTRANEAAAAFFGMTAAALVGAAAESLLPTLEDAAFWADVRSGSPGRLSSETELVRPDGSAMQALRRVTPVHGAGRAAGLPGCYLVQLRDRSGEHAHELERETLLAELRATLEATADGILVVRPDGGIQAFNRRFAAMWDLPQAALAERNDAAIYSWMRQQVLDPDEYQRRLDEITAQMLLSTSDTLALVNGALVERRTQPQWSRGQPIGRVFSFREQNRRRPGAPREEAAMGDDALTRWPNRGGFMAALGEAVSKARTGDAPLAVLCIEYDRDALYHAEAAARARTISELVQGLRACVRGPHLIARLGAARFAVLLYQAGDAAAEGLAHRLIEVARGASSGVFVTEGLHAVVGIAAYPQAGLDADKLLLGAERALLQARQDGGPGWRVHRPVGRDDSDRLSRLEHSVREELATGAFHLQYQPRVDMASGRIRAVEALLRWHDPARGRTLPAQFLPIAERAGLAGALDDWVMERALRQARQWREAGMDLALCVNVSAWQLVQPGYARRVAALLDSAGWPACAVEIDIGEAALLADPEAALANLRALRRLGVRVALEHFGSGETSLGLLRRFPLSAVKIDRALLRTVPSRPSDAEVVAALAQMAKAMHVEVHAVGVENEAQHQLLSEVGCQVWQGLLYAPPLDTRAMERCARDAASLLSNVAPGMWPQTAGSARR
jgi:diguanylate cyclase (GGDEF)-like protein